MIPLPEIIAKKFVSSSLLIKEDAFFLTKIAGDASFRSYYRINSDKKSFILMFAPPKFEKTSPFIEVANILIDNQINAPKIIAKNQAEGLLIIEDFGDFTLAKFIQNNISILENKKLALNEELRLYKMACDSLLKISQINQFGNIARYNNGELFREMMLFVDWYLPHVKIQLSDADKGLFKKLCFDLFDNLSNNNQVLVLRDYHSENIMVISQNKLGLLDFQDALIGSPAYDFLSLLEDARRDIKFDIAKSLFQYYQENSNFDKRQFAIDYAIFSLQRNLKILGIFCRLANRDGKMQYLELLPRVFEFIKSRCSLEICPFSNIQLPMIKPLVDFLKAKLLI